MGKRNRSRKRSTSNAAKLAQSEATTSRPASAESTGVPAAVDAPLMSQSAPSSPKTEDVPDQIKTVEQEHNDSEKMIAEHEVAAGEDESEPMLETEQDTTADEEPQSPENEEILQSEEIAEDQIDEGAAFEEEEPSSSPQTEAGNEEEESVEEAAPANTSEVADKVEDHPLVQTESVEAVPADRAQISSQLDKQFKRRASLDVLKDQGIYHGQVLHDADGNPYAGGASALQSLALQLEKDKNKNQLEYLLETRPDRDEVYGSHGVAPAQIAPSIQPNRRSLDIALRRDSLKHNLDHRPQPQHALNQPWFQPTADEEQGGVEASSDSHGRPSNRAFRRVLMSVSLKVLAQLFSHGIITDDVRGMMKELVFDEDERLIGAVQAYAHSEDAATLLTTFCAIANSLLPPVGA